LLEARTALEAALEAARAESAELAEPAAAAAAAARSLAASDVTEVVTVPETHVGEPATTTTVAAEESAVFPTVAEPSAPPWDIEDESAQAQQPVESLPPPPAYDELPSYDEIAAPSATAPNEPSTHGSSEPPPPPFEEATTTESRSRNGSMVSVAASDDADFMDADAFEENQTQSDQAQGGSRHDSRGASTVGHPGSESVSMEHVQGGGEDTISALQEALAEAEARAEAAEDAQRHSESLIASIQAELTEAKEVAEALGSVVSSLEGQQKQQEKHGDEQAENGEKGEIQSKNESNGDLNSNRSSSDAEAALAAACERVALLETELAEMKASSAALSMTLEDLRRDHVGDTNAASILNIESSESKASSDDDASSSPVAQAVEKGAAKPMDGTIWLHYKHQGEAHPMRYVSKFTQ